MIVAQFSGEGRRDKYGEYIPVAQCNPVSMKYWGKKKKLTGGLSYGQLAPAGQLAPVPPDTGSYEQLWDTVWSTCVSMAGEDACRRLLGYTPFVCPVGERKGSFLVPLLIGAIIGKIIL